MNAVASLFDQLPHLSPEELREVRDKASALLAPGLARPSKAEKRVQESEFARLLYDSVAREIERRTQVKSAPFPVAARQPMFRERFLPGAEAAEQANAQWFPKQTRAERASMAALYAQLVVEDLLSRGKPLLWPFLGFALLNLPAVVDRAFPGYASSGLLGKVQSLRCRGSSPV